MVALSENSRKYLVIALAVLLVILSVVLIYVQYNTLVSLRAEVEEEEMLLITAQARLNRLIDHRNNAPEYEMRLEYARRMIPGEPGEDAMLRYIQRLANDYDLRAVNIGFGNRADQETYTTMPITMTIEGSYPDLQRMLRQLRDGSRAVRVDNISIGRTGAADSQLRVTLSAATFYNQNN